MTKRYVCIHGHFYQPPRENPWLEAIEPQDSAAPFNDWNARINSECYAPNGVSRVRGPSGRIIRISNNYSQMSFNFGPTLLSWMAQYDPEALSSIVEGDKQSCERLAGHGNAMAQAYNHMIMPLASERDRKTQVRWGITDFRNRFGREPEGMWLPEAAVDTNSLEALAEYGLKFAVLAPRQARRIRPLDSAHWQDLKESSVDPRRAYMVKLPSGRSIALFFYDGGIAHGVAFGGLLSSGQTFAEAFLGSFRDDDEPQLVHIATDGESYGHHHQFGDMALGYALDILEQNSSVELTNYAAFLADNPPTWEVEIHENSSWSCAHGVERWRADCGCNAGTPDYNQRWRKPLRQSLDQLKVQLDRIFEAEGARCIKDPWVARDDYIRVILDRSDDNMEAFLQRHLLQPGVADDVTKSLSLLEMQRNGMLMFTSCGWFFDEFSGLEGTQILKYALRALQLAEPYQPELEAEFLETLGKAKSNRRKLGDGKNVWQLKIKPARVDLQRVVAHYAISAVFGQQPKEDMVYAYDAVPLGIQIDEQGDTHLAMGSLRVSSQITRQSCQASFAVLHFGGLDMHAWVSSEMASDTFHAAQKQVRRLFHEASIGDVYDLLRREFKVDSYKVQDLFARERHQLVDTVINERVAAYRGVLAGLVTPDLPIVERLKRLGYPLPPAVKLAADIYVEQVFTEMVMELDEQALQRLLDMSQQGYSLEKSRRENMAQLVEERLLNAIGGIARDGEGTHLALSMRLLQAAEAMRLKLNFWAPQNALLKVARFSADKLAGDRDLLASLATRLDLDPGLLRS